MPSGDIKRGSYIHLRALYTKCLFGKNKHGAGLHSTRLRYVITRISVVVSISDLHWHDCNVNNAVQVTSSRQTRTRTKLRRNSYTLVFSIEVTFTSSTGLLFTCFSFRICRSRACRARTGRDLRVAVVGIWVFLHFEAELRAQSRRALEHETEETVKITDCCKRGSGDQGPYSFLSGTETPLRRHLEHKQTEKNWETQSKCLSKKSSALTQKTSGLKPGPRPLKSVFSLRSGKRFAPQGVNRSPTGESGLVCGFQPKISSAK